MKVWEDFKKRVIKIEEFFVNEKENLTFKFFEVNFWFF